MAEVVEGLIVKDSRGCRDGCINNLNWLSIKEHEGLVEIIVIKMEMKLEWAPTIL